MFPRTRFFPKDLSRNKANKNFQYQVNTVLMTKFSFKFKTYFWPFLAHFPNFGGKKSFSMKSSCYTQPLKGFWHHAKFQRNLMIQLCKMDKHGRQGWTDPIS